MACRGLRRRDAHRARLRGRGRAPPRARPAPLHHIRAVARARRHPARIARGAGAPGARDVRRRRGRVRRRGGGPARPGDRGGAAGAGAGPPRARARAGGAVPGAARPGRVARRRRRAVRFGRALRASPRRGRHQESRCAVFRGRRAGAGGHAVGATPHQFHFWTANETTIGIGAIVRVAEPGKQPGKEEGERVVYGVVTDGLAYSDLATPLHDVVGAEGDPAKAAESPTIRQEIRLWTAAVLRQHPEEPLQPVPLGAVYVATDADVAQALRMDAYVAGTQPTGIPVGLYTAAGLEAAGYLDADFRLRPEAGHLNISGVSGLATKTSAVEFLLASIFQHFPAHK